MTTQVKATFEDAIKKILHPVLGKDRKVLLSYFHESDHAAASEALARLVVTGEVVSHAEHGGFYRLASKKAFATTHLDEVALRHGPFNSQAFDRLVMAEVEYLTENGWYRADLEKDEWNNARFPRRDVPQGHAVNIQKQADRMYVARVGR